MPLTKATAQVFAQRRYDYEEYTSDYSDLNFYVILKTTSSSPIFVNGGNALFFSLCTTYTFLTCCWLSFIYLPSTG